MIENMPEAMPMFLEWCSQFDDVFSHQAQKMPMRGGVFSANMSMINLKKKGKTRDCLANDLNGASIT